jgi:hypothetical protein
MNVGGLDLSKNNENTQLGILSKVETTPGMTAPVRSMHDAIAFSRENITWYHYSHDTTYKNLNFQVLIFF